MLQVKGRQGGARKIAEAGTRWLQRELEREIKESKGSESREERP